MSHLKEQGMTYWQHWLGAIKISLALFIHAWIPYLFTDYASKKILDNMNKND
tara:strand:+ start:1595 stop:1750 length:156 start_codon:yes stop_codon:yes gene_type:complete